MIQIIFCLLFLATAFQRNVYAQSQVQLTYLKESRAIITVYSGDQDFISLRELADLIDAKTFENPAKKKMVLFVPDHQMKVTAFNPFIVLDESTMLQMPVPCQFIDGNIFVPLQYFIPILNGCLKDPVMLNGQKMASTAPIKTAVKVDTAENNTSKTNKSTVNFNLTAIDFEAKSNGLLIRIKTDKDFNSNDIEIWRNKNWIYVTISDGVYSDSLVNGLKKGGQFKPIKTSLAFQHKKSAQLSFQLNEEISGQDVFVDDKNGWILVSLREAKGVKTVGISQKKDQWKIDKIVLDAGHGGKDRGATGKNGYKEKDATLAVILKLGKLVEEKLKIPVEYTRSKDDYITLKGRTQFANKKNAKLFVSVHCNANKKRTASGFEVFFLSPSRNSEALDVARQENEVIEFEEDKHSYGDFTDEKFILANIMQSVFVKESEELAAHVSKGIDQTLDLENRGVTQAPFYVLMGASMPSILVETAFISNPTEEKFLKSEDGQRKLAEGILEGIKKFVVAYEKSRGAN